jgi:MFS family permease
MMKKDGRTYPWYVVGVLTLAYLISFLDSQILALMVGPIKADLDLTDTQISLLMGVAFSIFYIIVGIPLGRLADRKNRRNIIALGITFWSIMTAACGLAFKFSHLFLARIGVGVGEASLTPSAVSMISDYFSRKDRGRAIATYNMGVSLGTGFAMVLGGAIVTYVAKAPPVDLPIIGILKGWQYVFFLVALPGLFVAVLVMLTVREPPRTERLELAVTDLSFGDVMKYLWQRKTVYLPLFLGLSVATIIGYAYFSWIPSLFVRIFHWTIPQVGTIFGVIILIAGPAGVMTGGWVIDTLYQRGHFNAPIIVSLAASALCLPTTLLLPMMPTAEWAFVMIFPTMFGGAMATAAGAIAVVTVTPNQMRGQTMALYLFCISLLGLSIGPTAVALLTDYVFYDEQMLHWSIAIVCSLSAAFSCLLLTSCLKPYYAAVREIENVTGE